MMFEQVKRSRYASPPIECEHSSQNHYDDWQEFHLPMLRMHHAGLHGLGVAQGLAVSALTTAAADETPEHWLQIEPGVAIDGAGELIVLAADGQADVGPTEPGELEYQTGTPFQLSTANHLNKTCYVTIQFNEFLHFSEGSCGKMEQRPWLRLQPATGSINEIDAGLSIVLAIATIDADGVPIVAAEGDSGTLPYQRQSLDQSLQQLRIRRSTVVGDTVQEVEAGQVGPGSNGGLHITVPDSSDTVSFSQADENSFSSLSVRANDTNLHGNLEVNGSIRGADGNLQVGSPLRLPQGVAINEFSSDGTLASDSDQAVPTERAVRAYIDNLLVGSVAAFATDAIPPGWLECRGTAISRTQYSRLFDRIGTRFGAGNGATTFNLPDLRGQFIRGWANGSSKDPDRGSRTDYNGDVVGDKVGSYQNYTYASHNHNFSGTRRTTERSLSSHNHSSDDSANWSYTQPSDWFVSLFKNITIKGDIEWIKVDWKYLDLFTGNVSSTNLSHFHYYTPGGSISYRGGSESRPTNAYLMFCIKY